MITEASPEDMLALGIDPSEHQNPDDTTMDEANLVNFEQPDAKAGFEAQIAARGSSSENMGSLEPEKD